MSLGPNLCRRNSLRSHDSPPQALSNKEIGERLFLSHRTVSTHLHQIFPNLGITSRAAL